MCGIIGIVGKDAVTPRLIEGLRRLEYRGYNSAGVATLVNGHIGRRRAEGKIASLEARVAAEPLAGVTGIAHTRWATHGGVSERNAHPIATEHVAIVHNGIIENFQELKDQLVAEGRRFDSETDTEVVAQLLTSYLEQPPDDARGGDGPYHGAIERRLRPGLHVRRPARPPDRRAAQLSARRRLRRGRDVPWLRRIGPGAAD